MATFTFNSLLEEAGVPVQHTRLVRHQDTRSTAQRTPYSLWLAQDGSLERYQEIQSESRFQIGDWLAAFVVTPFGETIFVGLYLVEGVGSAPSGTLDPISGRDVTGLVDYQTSLKPELSEHIGRLVIDWGGATRAWIQLAKNQNKTITELRKSSAIDPPFPGYPKLKLAIRDLPSVPQAWRETLTAASGVYVLTCRRTGKIYVGSAIGEHGFWGRWQDYYRTGHGGNLGMKAVSDPDFQVSILEVAASTASEKEIIELESLWKDRLLSREFGLNKN